MAKNMNDNDFNLYMLKFKNRYTIEVGGDNVRGIRGRYGEIESYDPEKQLLGVWCINMTAQRKTSLLRRLTPYLIEAHQDCDREFGAYFHESNLDEVAKIIKARRKKILSDDQKKILADRARKNFHKFNCST